MDFIGLIVNEREVLNNFSQCINNIINLPDDTINELLNVYIENIYDSNCKLIIKDIIKRFGNDNPHGIKIKYLIILIFTLLNERPETRYNDMPKLEKFNNLVVYFLKNKK